MIKIQFRSVLLSLITLICFPASALASGQWLQPFTGQSGTIDIAGGTAHIPVMKEAAKRIMTFNPDIRITVAGGGSGVGVQKVGKGLVDIGNSGRPVSDAERAKYGLKSFPFAIDGVGVAVHPNNPVSNLAAVQVKDIFAGAISNWKTVGGPDAAINVYTRDEASGTRNVFWKKLLDKGTILQAANVVPSNGAMKVAISRDPRGIGYLSIGHMDDSVSRVSINGVKPSRTNAVKGRYTVIRRLFMNTRGEPSKLVQTFIDFILSPEGGEIVAAKGFIPLK